MTPARITLLFVVVFGVSTVRTQTCYQDLLQCKNQSIASSLDACRVLDNWLNCLSGKGSSCSLEETNGVSFQAVKDLAKKWCPSFAAALGTDRCRQLVSCLSNDTQSKYISLINTNTYTNETVKTGFWCSFMSDAVNCAITHAADCALTKDTTTALSKSRDNAQRVCQNKGVSTVRTPTCYQDLLQCKNQAIASSLDACRVLDNWLNCLSGKGSSCSLEETNGVSFQAVKDLAKKWCPAFDAALGTDRCRQLVSCLSNDTQSKYISLIYTNTYTNETVKTGFWCSFMSDAVNCAITHAADCALTKDTTTALSKSRDNAQRVCQNKGVSTVRTQTCYQDLLQCKNQAIASSLDPCRVLDNWLNCLSGKGSSCSLEETNGVSFQAVKDVTKKWCPAFAAALGTDRCRQLVSCLSNDTQSKYISLINTNTYTNETVKTGFWCSFMSDAVNCAITHAADCALTKDTTTALSKSRDNAQRVCQNKGVSTVRTQTCYQDLLQCKNQAIASSLDACRVLDNWLNCLSGKGSSCSLEETNGVSFQAVKDLAKKWCPAFAAALGTDRCRQLVSCLSNDTQSKYISLINTNTYTNETVKTGFWCSFMSDAVNCAITHAADCALTKDTTTALSKSRDNAQRVCQNKGGAGSMQEGTLTVVLALLAIALLQKMIF